MLTLKKSHRPIPGKMGGPGGPGHKRSPEHDAFMTSESGTAPRRMKELQETYTSEMGADLLEYWKKHGVRKELFDADHDGGAFRYSVHTPMEMEEGKTYPLIY